MQRLLGVTDFDLAVRGVNNKAIQRLNRQFRGLDEPTDVLAFPAHAVRCSCGRGAVGGR